MLKVPRQAPCRSKSIHLFWEIAFISPGDTVQILDEREYTVLRVNPHSGTVVLRRVDATPNQRSFMRPSTAICVLPPASQDACLMVDEPTPSCLCEPTPPRVWPDSADPGTQCCVDTDEYAAFLTKRFDDVTTLNQAFEDARRETSLTMDVLCEQLETTKELEAANEALQKRLSALTAENESLLQRTLELTEELSTLRNLAAFQCQVPVLQRMLAHHITKLPLQPEPEDAPDNLLFNLLGCNPSSYAEIIQENYRVLVHTLHPDKKKAATTTASKYIPFVKEAKRIFLDPTLKEVYACCGLPGIQRNEIGLRTCRRCDPFLRNLHEFMDL